MNSSCVFGVVLVTICISGVSSGICFLDQMLTSAGECVDCPFCPRGQGMDLEQKVRVFVLNCVVPFERWD